MILVPILVLLIISPFLLKELKAGSHLKTDARIKFLLDSLDSKGLELSTSPFPVFNPMDTARGNSQTTSFRRIPFSESDSVTLQIVPGVGPSLASRIVKYRENLGGFQDKSQLIEIYGLKTEVIEKIWNYFDFDPGIKRKIRINLSDVGDLAKHPYIGFGEAKVIVAFRNQHGSYQNTDDLLKIKIFDQEWVRKISPYLDFDDGNSPE